MASHLGVARVAATDLENDCIVNCDQIYKISLEGADECSGEDYEVSDSVERRPLHEPGVGDRKLTKNVTKEAAEENWDSRLLTDVRRACSMAAALADAHENAKDGGGGRKSVQADLCALGVEFSRLFGTAAALEEQGAASSGDLGAGASESDTPKTTTLAISTLILRLWDAADRCGGNGGATEQQQTSSAVLQTCYESARDVEEDLNLMLSDPERFLFDPDLTRLSRGNRQCLDFRPLQDLYGTEQELKMMQDAFQRVCRPDCPSSEAIFVSGYSGTGKSSLVEKFLGECMDKSCYAISGKFDQLHGQPYSAISVAFEELCKLILAETEQRGKGIQEKENRSSTKADVLEAVGGEWKALSEILPSFGCVVSDEHLAEAASSSVLGVMESRNRFDVLLRAFVGASARPGKPLVLFLDNLHWADTSSLHLIKMLLTDSANKSLLFVGCYRENEVMADHPIWKELIPGIEGRGAPITNIKVGNLDEDVVNALISDALHMLRRLTRPLNSLVYRKTMGNLFFTVQFLKSLCDDGLLYFSMETMSWQWDEQRIMERSIADNVVALMARKILTLSEEVRAVLKLAALVGSCFEVSVLELAASALAEYWPRIPATSESIREILALAAEEGLISRGLCSDASYKFVHDRIHEAAYSLIPEHEREFLHYQVGLFIWKTSSPKQQKHLAFIAADQWNRGVKTMKNREEKKELVRLNLLVGERSIAKSAFGNAAVYLKAGVEQLEKRSWDDDYDLSLKLSSLLAESEYCIGDFEQIEQHLDGVFTHGKSLYDKIPAYTTLIHSSGARGQDTRAIDIGCNVLAQLGEPFPRSASVSNILIELLKTKWVLVRVQKTDEHILGLPTMTNKKKLAAMDIMNVILSRATFVRPKLVPIVVFRMVRLSLRYGVCKVSSYAFACYGMILCSMQGDAERGFRFGQIGLSLVDRLKATEWHARVSGIVYAAIHCFKEDIRLSLDPALHSHHIGMKCGDIEWALIGAHAYCIHSFYCGKPLEQLADETRKICQKMNDYDHISLLKTLLPYLQTMLNMMGRSDNPLKLTGEAMDESQMLEESSKKADKTEVCYVYVTQTLLACFFCDFDSGAKAAEKARRTMKDIPWAPFFGFVTHVFYDGLIAFSLARKTRKRKWMLLAEENSKKVKKLAKSSPHNFQHKRLLLKAEKMALEGHTEKAKEGFDSAISASSKCGLLLDEALANERAGIYWLEDGDQFGASQYFQRACECYSDWGAEAKAKLLRNSFKELRGDSTLATASTRYS